MKIQFALATALLTVGCRGTPILPATLVSGPRVLAIMTEPAEARPGQSVTARALTGGFAQDPNLQWTLCARPEETTTVLPLSSFGQFDVDRGCDSEGAVLLQNLGSGTTFQIPDNVLQNLDALRAAYGALSNETLLRLGSTLGISLNLTSRTTVDGMVVRAFKRLPVLPPDATATPNRNPPPPEFEFASRNFVGNAGTNGLQCESTNRDPLVIAPGTAIRLTPGPNEDTWIETYNSTDSEGRTITRSEEPFYSVFADNGTWDLGRSRQPDRAPLWTAPMTTGIVNFWFVVRDGRGGTSGCSFQAEVR